MHEMSVDYRCILVVEDEYMLAEDLRHAFEAKGSVVVGPVATVKDALAMIQLEALDAAVLDINLGGELIYPVADALIAESIPFVFATGYSRHDVPKRYSTIPRLDKPVEPDRAVKALAHEIDRH
jgi:CheY-like chemotaxis protein